jgi:hypothetical protein
VKLHRTTNKRGFDFTPASKAPKWERDTFQLQRPFPIGVLAALVADEIASASAVIVTDASAVREPLVGSSESNGDFSVGENGQ